MSIHISPQEHWSAKERLFLFYYHELVKIFDTSSKSIMLVLCQEYTVSQFSAALQEFSEMEKLIYCFVGEVGDAN